MIKAEVVLDSVSSKGIRLTTVKCRMPKFILAELNTHRVFSRSSNSSRAMGVGRVSESVKEDMFCPSYWGEKGRRMQDEGEITDRETIKKANAIWEEAAKDALEYATRLSDLGVHKQQVNRLLEPFMYVNTIITSTEWDNFFELRDSNKSQPEMHQLASLINKAMKSSTPVRRGRHIPLADEGETERGLLSAARCARISYDSDTERTIDQDLALSRRLIDDRHMSPFEHQAIDAKDTEFHRNFRGWIQFREMFE